MEYELWQILVVLSIMVISIVFAGFGVWLIQTSMPEEDR